MAARRKVKVEEPVEENITPLPPLNLRGGGNFFVKYKWVLVIAVLVIGFWYKTKMWPVAAVVNYQPITRYEIDKSLFEQGGKQVAENLITEALVKQELAKLGVAPTEAEIEAKIEEIKKGLQPGQELDKLLEQSGMTMQQLRERIKIQLGVEKAVTDKAQIASDEAEKLQEEIGKWVEGLKTNAKVWRFF